MSDHLAHAVTAPVRDDLNPHRDDGARSIAIERARQIDRGFTAAHDSHHTTTGSCPRSSSAPATRCPPRPSRSPSRLVRTVADHSLHYRDRWIDVPALQGMVLFEVYEASGELLFVSSMLDDWGPAEGDYVVARPWSTASPPRLKRVAERLEAGEGRG